MRRNCLFETAGGSSNGGSSNYHTRLAENILFPRYKPILRRAWVNRVEGLLESFCQSTRLLGVCLSVCLVVAFRLDYHLEYDLKRSQR